MNDILIEAKNLSKIKNEKTILKDINLTIKERRACIDFRKISAGKTTLLRILALIDKEYEGFLN
jgi:ABC-type sugar transport systems, ATPase components